MSLCLETTGFAMFLKERSNKLLKFFPTASERPALVINVPMDAPYYKLTQKFISQMLDSKRLDLDQFKDREITENLLCEMNAVIHEFIITLNNKKHLTSYIEGLR